MSVSQSTQVSVFPPQTVADTNFTSGESPIEIDLNTLLGKNVNSGELKNLGPGSLDVQISSDGINFGDIERIRNKKVYRIRGLDINTVRIALSNPARRSGYSIVANDPGQEILTDGGVPINNAVADPPGLVTGPGMTDTQLLPSSTEGRRGGELSNNGATPVWLAFDGNTPVIGSGSRILKDGVFNLDSTLSDDDEIRGISASNINISFQIWGDD